MTGTEGGRKPSLFAFHSVNLTPAFCRTIALLVFLGAALAARTADAHAFPDRSEPRVGSTVAVSPPEVKIWFDAPLEPVFCSIKVLDSQGNRVDRGDGRLDASDNHLLRVSLPPLQPGKYTVYWSVVAWDGHRTEGNFSFEVGR